MDSSTKSAIKSPALYLRPLKRYAATTLSATSHQSLITNHRLTP